ncbi:MAG: hypothetical protein JWQ52_1334 [Phenylobacterium sp.]|jgi:uncharacterized protein YidB (DUF937 family)|nr:hypothetical protein [Phenylobacterium sp.]
MGLLDGMLGGGQGQRTPGVGGTLAAGVALALLVKGVRQYQATHGGQPGEGGRSFDPQGQATQPSGGGGLGGLLGGLGGMLGGGGLGGILGSLGGAGALGSLVRQFQQKGMGQQVNSWVGSGQNQPIAPHEVEQVLGEDTLQQLEQHSGLGRQELLAQLAHELPQAISQATPQGRVPESDEELHQAARQPASAS